MDWSDEEQKRVEEALQYARTNKKAIAVRLTDPDVYPPEECPVSVLVDKIHDLALKQSQSFLLDGTLSRYEKAEQNVARSIRKGRVVQILYVYQEPEKAWELVLRREEVEGRNIRPEHFVEQYFGSRRVVNQLKKHFGKKVAVDVLVKNTRGGGRVYKQNVGRIDDHVPEKYTLAQLKALVGIEGET